MWTEWAGGCSSTAPSLDQDELSTLLVTAEVRLALVLEQEPDSEYCYVALALGFD